MLHESRWQSINPKVASPVFCLLASVEGTTVCLEMPLQTPPPQGVGDRHLATPPPQGGDRHALGGDFGGGHGTIAETHLIVLLCQEYGRKSAAQAWGRTHIPVLKTTEMYCFVKSVSENRQHQPTGEHTYWC